MSRFRWRVRRLKGADLVGDWQDSHEAARQDARRRGVAKWDREHGWFFDVFTSIEREEEREDFRAGGGSGNQEP